MTLLFDLHCLLPMHTMPWCLLPRLERSVIEIFKVNSLTLETIMNTLQNNGNVLIPIQSTTRVLELAYLLDQNWAFHRLSQPLLFLTHESTNTINLARSMFEWMGDGISQAFAARETPFDFRYLKTIGSLAELEKYEGPKVILSSFPGMNFGFSHELLVRWASEPNNIVLLTDRSTPGSIGRHLFDYWASNVDQDDKNPFQMEFDIPIEYKKRVPLEGEELEAYESQQQTVDVEVSAQQQVPSDSELSDEDEEENITLQQFDTLMQDVEVSNTGGFFKQHQAFKMFPVYDHRPRIDDYGEYVDTSEFDKFQIQEKDEMAVDIPQPELKAPEHVEPPSKFTSEEKTIQCRCKVYYIDFEGRSDARSIRNIVQHISPKRLVFVHASLEATDAMGEFCRQESITDDIYLPNHGECVDVSSSTNLYQVVLTDSLVSSMRLSKVNILM